MVKKYLKNTSFWISISHSRLYQKYFNPIAFKCKNEDINFYKNILEDGDKGLIFDVGANSGYKTSIFCKISKKVLAFEPSNICCQILRKRFRHSNVEIFNCALGSEKSSLDYYEIEGHEGYSSLSTKHIETTVADRNLVDIKSIKPKKVSVEIIEDYITKFGKPHYIKIDVEGFEYEVIKGLKTPVSLLSFESNLPEFSKESIEIINYLSQLSNNKYLFNFTTNIGFLSENFLGREEACNFVLASRIKTLEVYAKLN
jgi:FkbM family methyltransferase